MSTEGPFSSVQPQLNGSETFVVFSASLQPAFWHQPFWMVVFAFSGLFFRCGFGGGGGVQSLCVWPIL